MVEIIKRLVKEEEGQGMVEYGLIISLIALGVIVALTALGGHLGNVFNKIKDKMPIPS